MALTEQPVLKHQKLQIKMGPCLVPKYERLNILGEIHQSIIASNVRLNITNWLEKSRPNVFLISTIHHGYVSRVHVHIESRVDLPNLSIHHN